MAYRGDNVGSCGDKESSSSSFREFEEVLSHTEANRVITWLKPVRESQADALWKRFSFPPHVRVSISTLGPHFVDCTDGDRGTMNSIYWLEIHISEGLRFPLSSSLVPTLHPTPPRSCSCEHCPSYVRNELAK